MSDLAIRVADLGKRYRIGVREKGYRTLREAAIGIVGAPARNLKRLRSLTKFETGNSDGPADDIIWALKNVSFDVKKGEIVGIIGANGAGKSTLFKILSRITEPSTGFVEITGRVSSLLEVGTGFHPELTGRENVYLNATILGMRKKEIDGKFDEIVEFSGVGRFLDTPVKRYSSGMQMRLAFAVAAHLEPEVLIIDEVLSVGDAAFQKKCLGKIERVAREGRTVLFVSHNMGAVNQLCERAILLENGTLTLDGIPSEVTAKYLASSRTKQSLKTSIFSGPLASALEFERLTINSLDTSGNIVIPPSATIIIKAFGKALDSIADFRMTFSVFRDGVRLFTQHDVREPQSLAEGSFESYIEIPAFLLRPGEYSIALGGYRAGGSDWMWGTDVAFFQINEEWSSNYEAPNLGMINLPHNGDRILAPSEPLLID